jgi:hypothetical protein
VSEAKTLEIWLRKHYVTVGEQELIKAADMIERLAKDAARYQYVRAHMEDTQSFLETILSHPDYDAASAALDGAVDAEINRP